MPAPFRRASLVLMLAALTLFAAAGPAQAQDASPTAASAYGATATLAGQELIPPTPQVAVPVGEEDSQTLVDVPADPLAISGTLTATATSHQTADVESQLTVVEQDLAGPYNATGVGSVENLEVLVNQVGENVSLLTADVVQAEAVAVCSQSGPQFSATSEIVNLQIADQQLPLNAPVEQIVDALNGVLEQSGLNQVVNVERNVVEQTDTGASVTALVVTLLQAAGDDPVAQVKIAQASVDQEACNFQLPECSDTVDNDGDGVIDDADPGCHTDGDATNPDSYDPQDDSEQEAPQCSDGVDNADPEDTLADAADPGCHTDGNADNPDTYDANDNDETDEAVSDSSVNTTTALPRTGSNDGALAGGGMAMGLGALALVALRRRFAS